MSENDDLRELVADWRGKADVLYDIHETYEDMDTIGEVGQIEILADQLERCLDERADRDGSDHLERALFHAERAREKFEDGSREESVADNAVRWTRKSVSVTERCSGMGDDDE